MSLVIVGAEPNLGPAVARRFGREGLAIGLISRTEYRLVELAGQLSLDGITLAGAAADIRDSDTLGDAIRRLGDELGPVEVLEYSPLPAPEFMEPVPETTVEDVRGPLKFSVLGAVAATQAVIGPMREAGHGTIVFTTGGAAVKPTEPLAFGVYGEVLEGATVRLGDPVIVQKRWRAAGACASRCARAAKLQPRRRGRRGPTAFPSGRTRSRRPRPPGSRRGHRYFAKGAALLKGPGVAVIRPTG